MFRKAFIEDRLFASALFVSMVLHAVLLVILPGLKLLETIESNDDWLEVDIVLSEELDEILPNTSQSNGQDSGGNDDVAHIGESPLFPSPPIWLPERLQSVDTDSAPLRLRIPSDQFPDLAGPSATLPGVLQSLNTDDTPPDSFEPTGQSPPSMPWRPSPQPMGRTEMPEDNDVQITGEVAHRTVTFRPPPPRPVSSAGAGLVVLTFRVEPDGTIGRIVPVIRTHPELEQIAITYLEKWRFEAVQDSIGTQTGTVTIRFRFRS
jgi:TonB family protein